MKYITQIPFTDYIIVLKSAVGYSKWHMLHTQQKFYLNPFQLSVAFHIETSNVICSVNFWFLYETQHRAEKG